MTDDGNVAGGGASPPRPARPSWLGPILGLAATVALAGLMLGGPLRSALVGGGLAPSAELLAGFDPAVLSLAFDTPDPDPYGIPAAGDPVRPAWNALAFRVGVRLVDYEAAHRAGAAPGAVRKRLLRALRDVQMSQPLVASYEALADPATPPERAALEAAVLAHLESRYAELGRWAEAVRLAALAGNSRFSATLGPAPTVIAPPMPVARAYADLQTELAGDAPDPGRVAALAADLIAIASGD